MFFIALAGLYWLCRGCYYVGFFNDDAFFIVGARSLLQGRFVELNQPGTPPLINYMPGYPLLLAPLAAVSKDSFLFFQLLSIVMSVAGLWLFSLYIKEEKTPAVAIGTLALAALNPIMVSLSATVLSDVPYFLFSMLAFEVSRRLWKMPGWRECLALALICAVPYYMRPVGLAVGTAFFISFLLEQRWKTAGVFLLFWTAAVVPFALPNTMRYAAEMFSPYKTSLPLPTTGRWFFQNAAFYVNEAFSRNLLRWPVNLLYIKEGTRLAAMLLTAWGVYRWKGKDWRKAPLIYLGIYAVVHLVWSKQSGRYLFPVFPFIAYFFLKGVSDLAGSEKGRRRWPLIAAGLSLLCMCLSLKVIVQASLSRQTPLSHPPEKTLQWVNENTKTTSIFASELDGRLFLLSGRQSYHLPKLEQAEQLNAWLKDRKVEYIWDDQNSFELKTHLGNTPHDPLPAGRLKQSLDGNARFELAFQETGEGTAIYKQRENKPNP